MSSSPSTSTAADETPAVTAQAAESAAVAAVSAVMLDDLERQYVAVTAENAVLQQQLSECRAALAEATAQLVQHRALDSAGAELQHSLQRAQPTVAALEEDLRNVRERADRTQAEGDALREELRCVCVCVPVLKDITRVSFCFISLILT